MIVSQLTISHATLAAVEAYHGFEERILQERAADLRAAGGLFAVHDWRSLESYDGAARSDWQERMRSRPKGYLRGSVVCVERANALLKMAVQAANMVASITHGAKVELTTELAPALQRHGVKKPGKLSGSYRLSVRPGSR